MTFADDIRALKAREATLAADTDAKLTQLTTALAARLRPLTALDWLTDDGLQQASRAFVDSAIRTAIAAAPPPAVG